MFDHETIKGPIEIYDAFAVKSIDDLIELQKRTQRRGVMRTVADVVPVARVDHGRWCCDCVCGNGMAASRAWNTAICIVGCGARYFAVIFPVEADAIEAVLLRRERDANRNWRPGETLADLMAENAAAGIASVA